MRLGGSDPLRLHGVVSEQPEERPAYCFCAFSFASSQASVFAHISGV